MTNVILSHLPAARGSAGISSPRRRWWRGPARQRHA